MEHIGYTWFVKKLKRYCDWFGTYKKRFVIRDAESLNSIPAELLFDFSEVPFCFQELRFCFSEVSFYISKKKPYCFLELPFCLPEVSSFYLLCAYFSKKAFFPADCTFSFSCSELLRKIIYALHWFCFLLELLSNQLMIPCLFLVLIFLAIVSSSFFVCK